MPTLAPAAAAVSAHLSHLIHKPRGNHDQLLPHQNQNPDPDEASDERDVILGGDGDQADGDHPELPLGLCIARQVSEF